MVNNLVAETLLPQLTRLTYKWQFHSELDICEIKPSTMPFTETNEKLSAAIFNNAHITWEAMNLLAKAIQAQYKELLQSRRLHLTSTYRCLIFEVSLCDAWFKTDTNLVSCGPKQQRISNNHHCLSVHAGLPRWSKHNALCALIIHVLKIFRWHGGGAGPQGSWIS